MKLLTTLCSYITYRNSPMCESAAYRDILRWLFSRQFRNMLLALLAPEIMLIDAVNEFFKARFYANQTANLEADGWKLTHLSPKQLRRSKNQKQRGADLHSRRREPSLMFAAHAVEHLANSFELAIDLARRVGGYEA